MNVTPYWGRLLLWRWYVETRFGAIFFSMNRHHMFLFSRYHISYQIDERLPNMLLVLNSCREECEGAVINVR